MSRVKGKRKLTLSVTVTEKAYDRVDELADNTTEGNISKFVEMLINDYWDEWYRVTNKN